ncbi:MAG TPA: anthranilate synthase component I, partial [Methylovirgula sp.]
MIEPSFAAFEARYQSGAGVLVSSRLAADLETPVSAFLKLSAGRNGGLFLLESVEGNAARGRYSMIGLDPDVVWRCLGDHPEIYTDACAQPEHFSPCPEPPLEALR